MTQPSAPLRRKDPQPAEPARPGNAITVRSSVLGLFVILAVSFGGAASLSNGGLDSLVESFKAPISPKTDGFAGAVDATNDLVLRDADIHPKRIYQEYLSDQSRTPDELTAKIARDFQELIGLYEVRQGVDDNFTLRIIDNRTGGLIEVVSLDSARAQYNRSGNADWGKIDLMRRAKTSELVRRYSKTLDRRFITVKWGRRNEILEARQRELPVVEHEVRLARAFGLSLLTTEIGTVETFNNDKLVSRVGARSRYQLMPSILRELKVNHYQLKTATGRTVSVKEEMHPLISMEAAYTVVRAYSNAMGHEIPGISAYHTGPFNVFRLFEKYLDEDNDAFNAYSNVVTAYLWGLTEGFDQVTKKTTFGAHSRNYVPSIFGALEATADVPIDTSATWMTELVRLKSGQSLYLSDLLQPLDTLLLPHQWKTGAEDSTVYQRFRSLNPHIALPEVAGAIIPEHADVKLTARVGRKAVRFFLPLGSSAKLRAAGLEVLSNDVERKWDHGPYYDDTERTELDDRYAALVESAGDFHFTDESVRQLDSLYFSFQRMARETPTWYRTTQYNVIRLHRRVWRAGNYSRLSRAVASARLRVNEEPLARLPELERLQVRPTDAVAGR